MRYLMFALVIFSLWAAPARAGGLDLFLLEKDEPATPPETHVISGDPGGIIIAYVAKYWGWVKNHDRVRIEGECASACTIILGIVSDDRMCATRNAEFAFHSASTDDGYTLPGTWLLWAFYQDRTARVLARHGWKGPSKHPDFLHLDAQEFVRPCKWEDYHG